MPTNKNNMQTINFNVSVPLTDNQVRDLALYHGYKTQISDPATEYGMMDNTETPFEFVSKAVKGMINNDVAEYVGVIPTSNEETDAQIQAKQAEIEALQKQAEEAKEAERANLIDSITIN